MIYEVKEIKDDMLKNNTNNSIIVCIDGNKIVDKDILFSFIAKELSFPYYFGRNWDALDECLQDLDWLDNCVNHISVVVRHLSRLLINEKKSEKKILFSCLNDASDFWDDPNDEFGYKESHPNLVFNVYYVED